MREYRVKQVPPALELESPDAWEFELPPESELQSLLDEESELPTELPSLELDWESLPENEPVSVRV